MCAEFFSAEKSKATQSPEVNSPDRVEKTTAGDGSELDIPKSQPNALQDEALSMAYLPHLNNYVEAIRQVNRGNIETVCGVSTVAGLATMTAKTALQARLGSIGRVAGVAMVGWGGWEQREGMQKATAEYSHLSTDRFKALLEKGQDVESRGLKNSGPIAISMAAALYGPKVLRTNRDAIITGSIATAPISLWRGHQEMKEFQKLADELKNAPSPMVLERPAAEPTELSKASPQEAPPSSEPAEPVLPKLDITTPELTPEYFEQFVRKKK